MVALRSRQRKLLKQSLLKWQWRDRNRTQIDGGTRVLPLSHLIELVRVVCPKIWILPIRVEHRTHLVDDIRVARARNAHVPLKPRNLGRVGEVRRTDIGRRES